MSKLRYFEFNMLRTLKKKYTYRKFSSSVLRVCLLTIANRSIVLKLLMVLNNNYIDMTSWSSTKYLFRSINNIRRLGCVKRNLIYCLKFKYMARLLGSSLNLVGRIFLYDCVSILFTCYFWFLWTTSPLLGRCDSPFLSISFFFFTTQTFAPFLFRSVKFAFYAPQKTAADCCSAYKADLSWTYTGTQRIGKLFFFVFLPCV